MPVAVLRTLKAIINFAIAVAATLFCLNSLHSSVADVDDISVPIRPGLAVIILIFVRVLLSRLSRQLINRAIAHRRTGAPPGVARPTTDDLVRDAKNAFGSKYGQDAVSGLAATIASPSHIFDRITEHLEFQTSRYEKTTTLLTRLSHSGTNLVPVLFQAKGALIDGLELKTDGKQMSTLPYLENQGATINVIECLVGAFNDANPKNQIDVSLKLAIVDLVASPDPTDPREVLEQVNVRVNGVLDDRYLLSLKQLIEQSSNSYLILMAVEGIRDSSVRVEITNSFERPINRRKLGSEISRSALGLRRRDHLFLLARASETSSYHLSARTPKGMYVHESCLGTLNVGHLRARDSKSLQNGLDPIYSRSAKYVHLYFRNLGSQTRTTHQEPMLRLNLRERPPGLLELSAVVSFGLAALVLIVSLTYDEIFSQAPTHGAWPTLLFGIPTLISGWIMSRIDGTALARVSILTLASCVALLVNSCAAVTAAAFKSIDAKLTDGSFDFGPVHSSHPIWGVIVFSCLMHFFLASYGSVSRNLRYAFVSTGLTSNTIPEHNDDRRY